MRPAWPQGIVDVEQVTLRPWRNRRTSGYRPLTGLCLVSHGRDCLSRRPDKSYAPLPADSCQLGILGQKTVTGMQRITPGFHRKVYQVMGIEIPTERVLADPIVLIRFLYV